MEKYQIRRLHSHFSHQNVFKKYIIAKYSLKTCVKNIVPMYPMYYMLFVKYLNNIKIEILLLIIIN